MPTLVRSKSVRSSRSSTSSDASPRVGFLRDPVSSVSRPADHDEGWAAYHFEMHARRCAYCVDPYQVHRRHQQLCDQGHRLAQEVARFLYNNSKGETYSTAEEENKLVRVEMPADYLEVKGLLKAIERSARHRSRSPFVSMDRTYYVAPRQRSRSVKIEQPKRPRSGEIVDWPATAPAPAVKAVAEINNSTGSRRGSLYEQDIADMRRNAKHYRVEVREPSVRDIREHRSSGYYR
ncbi:hypothetical protein BU24DRAFT_358087 [Aaosphaeria arxii CBS 175.79]|uniref:Uncharacterized protein n=1 Tax=Aaosphaeria arxii CBS 175.79 TaxID=1450172 RepID=A0A6A5X9J3_9PLEO|nr:uncharacterized protein BU24DRAFT_358087 [Aaosphaeria arxii CBS 175.79]KAF2009579.1 hypothetical protein BU24DRAFT_358087 [Aaosphaeria arxii CBS 175.79]